MALLKKLGKLLGEQAAADPLAPRLAVAQLLLELARADFARDDQELALIGEHLARAYGLDAAQLEELLRRAEQRVTQLVSLHESLAAINEALSPEEKRELLAMLWRVAYADGKLDKHEEALLRRLSEMLFLSHADFIREKLAVIGEQGT